MSESLKIQRRLEGNRRRSTFCGKKEPKMLITKQLPGLTVAETVAGHRLGALEGP